jgi:hypothetical protein
MKESKKRSVARQLAGPALEGHARKKEEKPKAKS